MHLHPHDRLRFLEAMAATYSCLGLKRKEAFVLREVLAVIMDMLLLSAREAVTPGTSARTSVGLGLGVDMPSMNGSGPGKRVSTVGGAVGVRAAVDEGGNESVLRLVRHVCDTYGVDLGKVGISQPGATTSEETGLKGTEDESDDAVVDPFGWPELQLGVVREAVAIAEALPGMWCHSTQECVY